MKQNIKRESSAHKLSPVVNAKIIQFELRILLSMHANCSSHFIKYIATGEYEYIL